MIKKGQLVKLSAHNSSDSWSGIWPNREDPALVVRGPYEKPFTDTTLNYQVTTLLRCVDVLLPSGKLIKGVGCNQLEKI